MKFLVAASVACLIPLLGASSQGVEPLSSKAKNDALKFIQEIYAPYTDVHKFPNGPDILAVPSSKIFTPRLATLLSQDVANGEAGSLDHDPLCACQDSEGLRLWTVKFTKLRETAEIVADIHMKIDDHPHQVDLILKPTADGYRISDISESGIPSVLNFLRVRTGEIPASDLNAKSEHPALLQPAVATHPQ